MSVETIVIWHIGGTDGYGPIEKILRSSFRDKVQLVVFEAREDTSDAQYIRHLSINGIKAILVNTCVSDKIGREEFYINKHPLSSSMLKPAEKAKSEHIPWGTWLTWGDDTELDRAITLPTKSLDDLVKAEHVPAPDILSIDAQGSEYDILRGGKETINDNTLCVVSEVEFIEIYAGQGLFQDQYKLLYEQDFRLVDILNQQFWHPGPIVGEGFLSVGEALFFRNHERCRNMNGGDDKEKIWRLLKLAATSYCFERYSNVYRIIQYINEQFGNGFEDMIGGMDCYQQLVDIHKFVSKNVDKYVNDKAYLQKELAKVKKAKRFVKNIIRPWAPNYANTFRWWV